MLGCRRVRQTIHFLGIAAVLGLLLAATACTKMPADDLFQYATAEERQNAQLADAADVQSDSVDGDAGPTDDAQPDGTDAVLADGETTTDAIDDGAVDAGDALDAAADLADGDSDTALPADATAAEVGGDVPVGDAEDVTADDAAVADVPVADADAVTPDDAAVADADAATADSAAVDAADDATGDVAADDDGVQPPADATADGADGGACQPADCDDGNACTADACDAVAGCTNVGQPGACDDGNACTDGDVCGGGVCLAGAPTSCEDGNSCTLDACQPASGCSHSPAPGTCTDGDACTLGDACLGGTCVAGSALICPSDGNPCTAEVCTSGACASVALPVGATCGTGAACDAGQFCIDNDPVAMVALPAGTYWMGSPAGEGDANEQPQHAVVLSAFALDKMEVTVKQYAAYFATLSADQRCSAANTSAFSCAAPGTAGACNWQVADMETQPLNCVDWYQAAAYCAWAGKRLPTEAEWEYAARSAGLVQAWPWGDAAVDCTLAVFDEGTGGGCGGGGTSAPCSRVAGNSGQGACDLAGNVNEWCADWYDLYTAATATDPVGPIASPGGLKAVRGGAWSDTAAATRAAARASQLPNSRYGTSGFRCARSP